MNTATEKEDFFASYKDTILSSLISNLSGGFFICKYCLGKATVLYTSNEISALGGRTPAEYAAEAQQSSFPDSTVQSDDRQLAQDKFIAAAQQQAPFNISYRIMHKSGIPIWVICSL